MTLSADADIAADEDLLGKVVADLQENVEIDGTDIEGTLHYLDDYTGFSGDPELQSGNYIALHFESSVPATIQAAYNDKTVTLTDDGILIVRVADKDLPLTVTATYIGQIVTKTYDLSDLTLEASGG